MKFFLIIAASIVLQAMLLHSFDVYFLHVHIVWILFVLLSMYFKPSYLPLLGAISGWLLALLENDLQVFTSIYGALLGLSLYWLVALPSWSLVWVRVVAALSAVLLYELVHNVVNAGLSGVHIGWFSLFVLLHVVVASYFGILIREPRYE